MSKHRNFPIYLDHNATTPLAPETRRAMAPYMEEKFGNPSSNYGLGREAKDAVERARLQVAALIGCRAEELFFTSGGTESNNYVFKGVVDYNSPRSCHIITCAVEHPAILNPALYLMELGVDVTIVPVDGYGKVNPDDIKKAIKPETRLISIMLANNETGTLQPVKEISKIASIYEIPVHTDAAQAVGKIPVDINELGVDFLTIAGHKLYGPKGIGAIFIRQGRNLTPLIHGAAQEGGRRAGTENVILSVGLGEACALAGKRLEKDMAAMEQMRDRLQNMLFDSADDLVLNGHPVDRLPNTLNIAVPGVEGGAILDNIPEIMASTGAACHDRTVNLSHVLSAMGVPKEVGMGAIRLTVGRTNTMEQIEEAGRLLTDQIRRMKHNE